MEAWRRVDVALSDNNHHASLIERAFSHVSSFALKELDVRFGDGTACNWPRKYCAGCGEPAGRPSQGGKALIGLGNRRGWDQAFYCLSCHPELGYGLVILEKMSV